MSHKPIGRVRRPLEKYNRAKQCGEYDDCYFVGHSVTSSNLVCRYAIMRGKSSSLNA